MCQEPDELDGREGGEGDERLEGGHALPDQGGLPCCHDRVGWRWQDHRPLPHEVRSVREHGANDRLQLRTGERDDGAKSRINVPRLGCGRAGEDTTSVAIIHQVIALDIYHLLYMDKGTPGAHILTIIIFTITNGNFIDIIISRCTDGIIFVVDSSQPESLEEARVELWRTMRWEISPMGAVS